MSPSTGKNKTCLKPPPSLGFDNFCRVLSNKKPIEMLLYTYIPRTQMTPMFEGQPPIFQSKQGSFGFQVYTHRYTYVIFSFPPQVAAKKRSALGGDPLWRSGAPKKNMVPETAQIPTMLPTQLKSFRNNF